MFSDITYKQTVLEYANVHNCPQFCIRKLIESLSSSEVERTEAKSSLVERIFTAVPAILTPRKLQKKKPEACCWLRDPIMDKVFFVILWLLLVAMKCTLSTTFPPSLVKGVQKFTSSSRIIIQLNLYNTPEACATNFDSWSDRTNPLLTKQ